MKKPKQPDLFIPEPEGQPPSTNRGVTVSIHWLSITYFVNIVVAMTHFLKEFLGEEIEDELEWSEYFYASEHGARGYRALYFGPEGIRLYGYPHTGQHCHLEIPGKVIEKYGNQKVIDYLKSLKEQDYEWRCKRVDIAFDYCPFTPLECYEAWQRGDVHSKCHRNSWDWRENADGRTLYIGSRMSDRFIRIYDRRGFTRLELEFKNRWSENFARVITEIEPDQWIKQCIGYLIDFIDFNTSDPSSCVSWWEKFIDEAPSIKLDVSKSTNNDPRGKLLNYFDKLIPTLYLLRKGCGMDINKVIDVSEHKLKPKHLRILNQLVGDG